MEERGRMVAACCRRGDFPERKMTRFHQPVLGVTWLFWDERCACWGGLGSHLAAIHC